MDRADVVAMARPAAGVRPLEQRFRRFSRWSGDGVWWRLFKALADDPDFEYVIVDATIVRAHQHATGKKGEPEDIPASKARARVSTHDRHLYKERRRVECFFT